MVFYCSQILLRVLAGGMHFLCALEPSRLTNNGTVPTGIVPANPAFFSEEHGESVRNLIRQSADNKEVAWIHYDQRTGNLGRADDKLTVFLIGTTLKNILCSMLLTIHQQLCLQG